MFSVLPPVPSNQSLEPTAGRRKIQDNVTTDHRPQASLVRLFLSAVVLYLSAHPLPAKQIQLLDGQLSFGTPVDVSSAQTVARGTDRYSVLSDLTSADGTFSVRVTYGKHILQAPDIADFLQQKVASYTRLNQKVA